MQHLGVFARCWHLTPRDVDELTLAEFDHFADLTDELLRQQRATDHRR